MSPIPDALHLLPSLRPSPTSRTTYILYFIPGNPGLISYYTTFLSHLLKLLTSNPTPPSIEIHGRSLSGFEVHPTTQRDGPYTVDQQIAHSEADVRRIVRDARRQGEGKDVKVILMGHSLGTYMVLELVRRLRKDEDKEDGVIVAGGVCLFATVMELAKSDSGVKARVGFRGLPYNLDVLMNILGGAFATIFSTHGFDYCETAVLVSAAGILGLVNWYFDVISSRWRQGDGFVHTIARWGAASVVHGQR